IAFLNNLAFAHVSFPQMGIYRFELIGMFYKYDMPVSAGIIRFSYLSPVNGIYRRSGRPGNVYPFMRPVPGSVCIRNNPIGRPNPLACNLFNINRFLGACLPPAEKQQADT